MKPFIDLELAQNEKARFKDFLRDIQISPELNLIWGHLDEDLHCRRSLDQYMHSSLEDTSNLDEDQVLYKLKGSRKAQELFRFKEE